MSKKTLPINHRPVFHLYFLSKLSERVVNQHLTHHLSSNNHLKYFSLLTQPTIPRNSHFYLFTTTSSRPWLNKKSLLFVSLISQLPSISSIPLITLFIFHGRSQRGGGRMQLSPVPSPWHPTNIFGFCTCPPCDVGL